MKLNLTGVRCEDGTWIELAQDHIQLQVLVFAVLNKEGYIYLEWCFFLELFSDLGLDWYNAALFLWSINSETFMFHVKIVVACYHKA
jgi:hypothetical protein